MKKEEVEEIRRIAEKAQAICAEIETLEATLPLLSQTYSSFQIITGSKGNPGRLTTLQGEKVLRLGLKAFITELNNELSQLHFPRNVAVAKVETPISELDESDDEGANEPMPPTEKPEVKTAVYDPEGNSMAGPMAFKTVPSIADEVNERINRDPTLRELING